MFGIDNSNFWTIMVCVNLMSFTFCLFAGNKFGSCFGLVCTCLCYGMLMSCKGKG